MTPDPGAEPNPPNPDGPWGAGGFEVPVYADEEPGLRNFVRSHVSSLSSPVSGTFANYICGMEHSRTRGGPGKPVDIKEALESGQRKVYDVLGRNKWSWRVVRHEATSKTLCGPGLDGIVVSETFTQYADPGFVILTAHAFSSEWRALVAVRRATIEPDGSMPDLEEAYQGLVEEIVALRRSLSTAVPVLAESPQVGQRMIPWAAKANLDYLIEVHPSWAEGGLAPAATGEPDRLSKVGATIREFFGSPHSPAETQIETVRLGAWSGDLPALALMAGPPAARRAYLGNVCSTSQQAYPHSFSRQAIEQWATRWSKHTLYKAADNYGFGHFRAKPDLRFQRHFTIVAVRDAYNVFRRTASGP